MPLGVNGGYRPPVPRPLPRLLLPFCLLGCLLGCAREPEPRPAPPRDDGWWRGEWALDLARLPAASVPPLAWAVAAQVSSTARYALDARGLVRTVADVRRVEPGAVRAVDPTTVELPVAGRPTLRVVRAADGVWLIDGTARLPLRRVKAGAADTRPAPTPPAP